MAKSPIINPERESGTLSNLFPQIVRDSAKKWQVSPWHLSLDHALNRWARPETLPDSKCSLRKSGVCFSGFAWHEWFLRAFPLVSFFLS